MTKYFGYKYLVNWPMIIEIYENPLGYFYCLLHTVRVNWKLLLIGIISAKGIYKNVPILHVGAFVLLLVVSFRLMFYLSIKIKEKIYNFEHVLIVYKYILRNKHRVT